MVAVLRIDAPLAHVSVDVAVETVTAPPKVTPLPSFNEADAGSDSTAPDSANVPAPLTVRAPTIVQAVVIVIVKPLATSVVGPCTSEPTPHTHCAVDALAVALAKPRPAVPVTL